MERIKRFFQSRLSLFVIYLPTFYFCFYLFLCDFDLKKIVHCAKYDARYEVENVLPKDELKAVLSQKFSYLGSGYQSFAFESADKQYVLKLAQLSHFKLNDIYQKMPLPSFLEDMRNKKLAKKQKNYPQYFASNKIGYTELKDKAGLIYVHLNPTKDLNIQVQLEDKIHRSFTVDLDKEVFVVQKKMKAFRDLLKVYNENNEKEKMSALVQGLVKYVAETLHTGVIDTDRNFYKNYGVLNDQIACLDTGNLRFDQNLKHYVHFSSVFSKTLQKTRGWLQKHYPDQVVCFDEAIQAELVKK